MDSGSGSQLLDSTVIVSAPGKVILAGEHAVVYSRPAIATSLDLRLRIRLERCSTNTIALNSQTFNISLPLETYNTWFAELHPLEPTARIPRIVEKVSAEFEQFGNHAICSISALIFCCVELYPEIPSLSITISSDIPLGAGLGSSAALSTALSATILIDSQAIQVDPNNVQNHQFSQNDLQTINSLSRTCEHFFHGNPSGIDNTIACHGGAIMWQNGEFEAIPVTNCPRVLVVETHVERSTRQMVDQVRRRRDRQTALVDSIFDSMTHIVQKWRRLLNSENILESYADGREQFEINQHLLAAIGVSHASIDAIVSSASEVGLAGKLTGAGGGGCVLILLPPSGMSTPSGSVEDTEANISMLNHLFTQQGFRPMEANIAEPGVRLESIQTEPNR